MKSNHVLEWLDRLTYESYNPTSPHFNLINDENAAVVVDDIKKETVKILAQFRNLAFNLESERQMKLTVRQYYKAIELLLMKVGGYAETASEDWQAVTKIYSELSFSFEEQLSFLENRYPEFIYNPEEIPTPKVTVNMSGDQISILLRVAFELKFLLARSVSAVFKAIIPNISTPDRDTLNWDSTRTKSYEPEQRDKDILIAFLYQMIEKIKQL